MGLQDVLSSQAAHTALVRAVLGDVGPFVWVQDARAGTQAGRVPPWPRTGCDHARRPSGGDGTDGFFVRARHARDVLWVMEEAVKAGIAVVGEIEGSPRVLDFTATRRLELFARAAGVPCILVRVGSGASLSGSSAAHFRWRLTARASQPDPFDAHAPGRPRWSLDLVRARAHPPGSWVVEVRPDERDLHTHRLHVVAPLADGDVGASQRENGGSGAVVPFERRAQRTAA